MLEKKEVWAVGRRKTSVARVKMTDGTGKILINRQGLEEYLKIDPKKVKKTLRPLELLGIQDKVDLLVNVRGGGISGQLIAIQHGIARAVAKKVQDSTKILRKEGLLTRDSRMVERKKYGLHKARRGTQFSKR